MREGGVKGIPTLKNVTRACWIAADKNNPDKIAGQASKVCRFMWESVAEYTVLRSS